MIYQSMMVFPDLGFFLFLYAADLDGIPMMRCPSSHHWPNVACKDLSQIIIIKKNYFDYSEAHLWTVLLDKSL